MAHRILKSICSALLFSALISTTIFAQIDTEKDKDWKVEIEPLSIVYKGFGAQVLYNLTENNLLSIGLYGISIEVPDLLKPKMFDNVPKETSARLGFEIAAVLRYKIPLFEMESNPYVGAIIGWEYFDIQFDPAVEKLRISTMIATPYVGYEFYVYKKMFYINPQLRSVFYFNTSTSDDSRPEKLNDFFLLPTVSLGIRF